MRNMILMISYDPDGRACGHDEGVYEYPYIYLVSPLFDFLNRSVCVLECPNW